MTASKDRVLVEDRRQKAYLLHLEGYNQEQIAKALQIAPRTVGTALSIIRRQNATYYQEHKDLHTRLESWFKEHLDRLNHIYNESFIQYRSIKPNEKNPLSSIHAKIASLQLLRNIARDMAELQGLRAPSIDELAFTEDLQKLVRELEELKQQAKVKPL